ncbi:hypothetical protein FOZ63_004496, partial [Perkinsus olseni]
PLWNAAQIGLTGDKNHRTSNIAEAFNRKLNRYLRGNRESFYYMAFLLLSLFDEAELSLLRLANGDRAREPLPRRTQCEKDLQLLQERYFSHGMSRLSPDQYQRYMILCASAISKARNSAVGSAQKRKAADVDI